MFFQRPCDAPNVIVPAGHLGGLTSGVEERAGWTRGVQRLDDPIGHPILGQASRDGFAHDEVFVSQLPRRFRQALGGNVGQDEGVRAAELARHGPLHATTASRHDGDAAIDR